MNKKQTVLVVTREDFRPLHKNDTINEVALLGLESHVLYSKDLEESDIVLFVDEDESKILSRKQDKDHSIELNVGEIKKLTQIQTTAKCLDNITLYEIDTFEKDKIYKVAIEFKGDILEECYSEYVYVDNKRLISEDFLKNFKLILCQ